MKKPIAWYKDCLKNRREGIERSRREASVILEYADKQEREATFLAFQIEAAEKAGKDGFDRDRYLVKKPNKTIEYK